MFTIRSSSCEEVRQSTDEYKKLSQSKMHLITPAGECMTSISGGFGIMRFARGWFAPGTLLPVLQVE